jgi:multiple sugar transport system permease protein
MSAVAATEGDAGFAPRPAGERTGRRVARVVGVNLGLLVVAVVSVLPFYLILYLALSKQGQELSLPPHGIPRPVVVGNLWHALGATDDNPTSMGHYFRNSGLYVVLATLGALTTQAMAGYALARIDFPGRRIVFGLTVAMIMMPFVVTLIPRFLLFRSLHMTDSLAPLIVPWWFGGSPYGIFLMRQFFLSVPRELEDAARIDGLGHWRILWKIMIPQALPVLAALTIIEGSYFWNDLLGPLIYTQSDTWRTVSLGVFAHTRQADTFNYAYFFSIVTVAVLPVALMFFALQRRFRQGFLFSGLGGR